MAIIVYLGWTLFQTPADAAYSLDLKDGLSGHRVFVFRSVV